MRTGIETCTKNQDFDENPETSGNYGRLDSNQDKFPGGPERQGL